MSFAEMLPVFVPKHLLKFPRASVGTVGLGMNAPTSFPFRAHARQRLVVCFTCPLNVVQKNKRPVAAVPSCSNLLRLLSQLTPASICGLCFWVTQLILFTNNSFCSTLRVSQRERDQYKPECPHRASFTFDYGPSAGSTLNQCELRNAGSAVCTEKTAFSFSWCLSLKSVFSCNNVSAAGAVLWGEASG